MNDTISEMIIRIKNAGLAGKPSVALTYSKLKFAIAELLKKEGFVSGVEVIKNEAQGVLEITLAYINGKPRINGVQRISKLSKRVYEKARDLKSVRQGFGALVLTTSKGIMTEKDARKENVGGEALFKIW